MKYVKYSFVLVCLLLLHCFLDSTWLIAGWCILGIVSCIWFREARYPLLNIVGSELAIGIGYWIFFWRNNDALRQIAAHSHTSPMLWPLLAIAVNIITAFLCSAIFFYLTRKIVKMPVPRYTAIPEKKNYEVL